MTPIYNILVTNPELAGSIDKVVWMGGAIDVPGNLFPSILPEEYFGKKAEWNVFWDPQSVDWIFENTNFPIIEYPLDVTNKAHITDEFVAALKDQSSSHKYSELVYQMYSLITKLSKNNRATYEMWDVLTTCYLGNPGLFDKPDVIKLKVLTEGVDQGALLKSDSGREVNVILEMRDIKGYYEYVLMKLKK